MASCPTDTQPPDIEELCKEQPRAPRKRTMTLQERELKHTTNSVRRLPRSVSDRNVVAICTCQQSKDFPFCDNTHSIFNKATNSNMAPLYVAFVDGDKCGDCGSKDNGRLSHSVDQTLTHKRGCSITLTNTPNKLHSSADKLSTSCCCKQSKQPFTLPPNDILETTPITEKQTTNIIPTISSSSSSSSYSSPTPRENTPTSTISPSPTTIEKTSPIEDTTSTTETHNSLDDTCNSTKAYIPSSLRSPVNKDNIITRAEVAEHAAQNDLWMIIKGNVYDITDYVQYHPGGVRALVKFAGQDGTENVHYHSSRMLELLNSHYFIGKLPKHEGGGGGCTIS